MGDLDVLCIGICTVDLIASVPSFPEPDGRMHMSAFTEAVGGVACVAGAALARLGGRVGFAGTVGDDRYGQMIRATLAEDGIDLSLLTTTGQGMTPITVIISDTSTGMRSIVNHPGIAAFGLQPTDGIVQAVEQVRIVHLDHTAFPAVADAIAPRCRAAGTLISLDAGVAFPDIERYFPLVDIYVTTDRQACTMTGERDVARALEQIRRAGPRVVAATMGEQGSIGLDENGEAVHVPAFDVPVVDSTGAGDVFHGAFLYGMLQGWAMGELLAFANAAAALSCGAIGGHPGCPTLQQAHDLLATGRPR